MKRTLLDVPPDKAAYARRFGAEFDSETKTWFLLGDVPIELLNLVPQRSQFVASVSPTPVLEAFAPFVGPQPRKAVDPEVTRVVTLALEVHGGSLERAVAWFGKKKLALNNLPPREFLGTAEGRSRIEAMLLSLYK